MPRSRLITLALASALWPAVRSIGREFRKTLPALLPSPLRERFRCPRFPTRGLSYLISILMVLEGLGLYPMPARATNLCQVGGQVIPCPSGGSTAAPLLNTAIDGGDGIYAATDAQYASLVNLQNQAVTNTLHDHGLPASDATAAQTWGRDDALSELWALIINAIATPACTSGQTPGQSCRTTDQQNAADWLTTVYQRDAILAAQDAGLEYVKWAGLNIAGYNNLIAANPSQDQIKTFLCGGSSSCPVLPLNYAGEVSTCPTTGPCVTYNGTHYTEGYCVFQPPAPFQSDYSDAGNILCSSTCPQGAICTPFGPSYDQLVKWGAADVQNQLFNTPEFAQEVNNVAIGLGFAAGTAATIAALSLAPALLTPAMVTPILMANSTSIALFPFATAAGVTIASVAALVLIAIAGAIAIGFFAVAAFDAAAVPGQLATLIVDARSNTPNLPGLLSDSTAMRGLYSLFIGATLPAPRAGTCNNLDVNTGAGCLNPPPIPGVSLNTDPIFKVQQNSGTASAPVLGSPAYSGNITFRSTQKNISTGTDDNLTTTARLSGPSWFVEHVSDTTTGTTSDLQTLRIRYTDWQGNGQTAWLLNVPGLGYQFVSTEDQGASGTPVNVSTCLTDGTCAHSPEIHFLDAGGTMFSASVIPASVPTLPSTVIGTAVEGSPTELQASSSSPIGEAISYTWVVEDKDPSHLCLPGPCWVNAGSGSDITYTFPTSGTFQVMVTATDTDGRSATSSLSVQVADVPPQLSIYPECQAAFGTICVGPHNQFTVVRGAQTVLGGVILHAGSADTEKLDVTWGDGTPDDIGATFFTSCPLVNNVRTCSPNITFYSSNSSSDSDGIHLPFSATHSYVNPGKYTVTLTLTDQGGGTDSKTVIETVLIPTTTTLSSSPDPSVAGQSVTYTATINPVPDGGTVAFTDGSTTISGCDAEAITAGGTATCTTAPATAGPHSISAWYSGNDTYAASTGSLTQSVGKAATTTLLTAQPNPSVEGDQVTLTASVTVNNPGAGTPTGSVVFSDDNTAIPGCENQPLAADGTATCTVVLSDPGTHTISAAYSGDDSFTGSSDSLAQRVLVRTATTLASIPNPSVVGQAVTYTATINPAPDGGTVTFLDGTTVIVGCSGKPISAGGLASCTAAASTAGTHEISAQYSGNDTYAASSGALSQTVNTASTTTRLSLQVTFMGGVLKFVYTATVSVNAPGAGNPTGTVTFKVGNTTIAGCDNRPLDTTSETTTCTTSTFGATTGAVTAYYNGDDNFAPSHSTGLVRGSGSTALWWEPK